MNVVFWQPVESPHQAPFIRELARLNAPDRVTCVFRSRRFHVLRQRGWQTPTYGNARVFYADEPRIEEVIRSFDAQTVHIFSALYRDPWLQSVFKDAVKNTQTRVGLLSEGRDWRGWKGLLRRVDSLQHERRWRQQVDFVLAMGTVGRYWFETCGFNKRQIFDFGYVVEQPKSDPVEQADEDNWVRLIYVGQLIRRKRVDLLMRSLAAVRHHPWRLDIVGTGPRRGSLERLAVTLGLEQFVKFHGTLPNEQVRFMLGNADILILPSYWDGWGAVVNEALSVGTRVICSNFCGAAALVSNPLLGDVFQEGSQFALAGSLERLMALGRIDSAMRSRIHAYSSSFAGPAVGQYVLRIIECIRDDKKCQIDPPWREAVSDLSITSYTIANSLAGSNSCM